MTGSYPAVGIDWAYGTLYVRCVITIAFPMLSTYASFFEPAACPWRAFNFGNRKSLSILCCMSSRLCQLLRYRSRTTVNESCYDFGCWWIINRCEI